MRIFFDDLWVFGTDRSSTTNLLSQLHSKDNILFHFKPDFTQNRQYIYSHEISSQVIFSYKINYGSETKQADSCIGFM